jgi:tRNA 2-selenouridine synthase
MPIVLTDLNDLNTLDFDEIIDVRSPAEFAEDHIPGAINLPVLDDQERAHVGTIYKQVNPFTARKLGAALVAQNAARHLLGTLADRPGGWRPLVYCWRGGQRSGSFATILAQIGWRVDTIAGGYKAWRNLIVEAVYNRDFPNPVVVLDGNTGSAKTEILNLLPARDVQVLDLEGMANHRGSLFGAMGTQPSQKAFESALAMAIAKLAPNRPVMIEAESSKVGERRLPSPIWKAMGQAIRIEISAPSAARAAYLARAYVDITSDPIRLAETLNRLRTAQPAALVDHWLVLAGQGGFEALASELMDHHYDPRYAKHRSRMDAPASVVAVNSLLPQDLGAIADQVAQMIAGPGRPLR